MPIWDYSKSPSLLHLPNLSICRILAHLPYSQPANPAYNAITPILKLLALLATSRTLPSSSRGDPMAYSMPEVLLLSPTHAHRYLAARFVRTLTLLSNALDVSQVSLQTQTYCTMGSAIVCAQHPHTQVEPNVRHAHTCAIVAMLPTAYNVWHPTTYTHRLVSWSALPFILKMPPTACLVLWFAPPTASTVPPTMFAKSVMLATICYKTYAIPHVLPTTCPMILTIRVNYLFLLPKLITFHLHSSLGHLWPLSYWASSRNLREGLLYWGI